MYASSAAGIPMRFPTYKTTWK